MNTSSAASCGEDIFFLGRTSNKQAKTTEHMNMKLINFVLWPLELETFLYRAKKPVFLSAARTARRAGCREWMLDTRIVVADENAKHMKQELGVKGLL